MQAFQPAVVCFADDACGARVSGLGSLSFAAISGNEVAVFICAICIIAAISSIIIISGLIILLPAAAVSGLLILILNK